MPPIIAERLRLSGLKGTPPQAQFSRTLNMRTDKSPGIDRNGRNVSALPPDALATPFTTLLLWVQLWGSHSS